MDTADEYVEVFKKAAEANHLDSFREGNKVVLDGVGRLVASGDLHGHRRNYQKIVRYAKLENSPQHHVILHELVHGGPTDDKGGDLSFEMIFEACKLKIRFHNQVHFLMGNHDLAQMTGQEVSRQGVKCLDAFDIGLKNTFGAKAPAVERAIYEFFASQPIALQADHLFFSHSTPARRHLMDFDFTVFDRDLTAEDVERGGAVYNLVWGRVYDQASIESLARRLNVEIFIIGHEPQPEGYYTPTTRHIIMASDHGHGVCLPIPLGERLTQQQLVKLIKPLASLP